MRVAADHLDQVLHPQFAGKGKVIAKGLAASPGAAVGKVYFTADDAADADERGEAVILVRNETSPEDVHGMMVSQGILTARGGLVSHAAVVARGWGTPAIVGADTVKIEGKQFTVGDIVVKEGDIISPRRHHRRGRARRDEARSGRAAASSSPRSSNGPIRSARASSPCAPTPTPARTRPTLASSAPRASACAAPSTCSWRPIACRSCAR